jgi:uncharacterized protein (DUF1697 family)
MIRPVERVALIRGINVGGNNLVKMADLREAFAELGASDVRTHVASGNVLFRGALGPQTLEAGLSERFGIELKAVVMTAARFLAVVDAAPEGFGSPDDNCDVIFLRRPLTVARAFSLFNPREGIDRVWRGKTVIYHARLAARASGSRLSTIVSFPEYQDMTIRSWSTTRKLAGLLAQRGAD